MAPIWIGAFGLLVVVAGFLVHERRHPVREHTVTVESDEPLTPEDLAALRVLFDRHLEDVGDQLYDAIVAQVAEDATEAEADAFLRDVLDGEAS